MRDSSKLPAPDLTMAEITAILSALSPYLPPRTLRQMTLVVEAVLAMTGRVTMLGLSRWAEKGGSYRTVQRFFKEKIDWPVLRWQLLNRHTGEARACGCWRVTRGWSPSPARTRTGWAFFSSIHNKPLPGLCFLNLSLLRVETRESYPLVTEQLVRGEIRASAPKAPRQTIRSRAGPRAAPAKPQGRGTVVIPSPVA